MADARGLIHKYDVHRVDGSDAPGGKHDGCPYFVLDLFHDKAARRAAGQYAALVEFDRPELARELHALIQSIERESRETRTDND